MIELGSFAFALISLAFWLCALPHSSVHGIRVVVVLGGMASFCAVAVFGAQLVAALLS